MRRKLIFRTRNYSDVSAVDNDDMELAELAEDCRLHFPANSITTFATTDFLGGGGGGGFFFFFFFFGERAKIRARAGCHP